MYEDSDCVDCSLHKGCKNRCLPSVGDPSLCKLAIYLDAPAVVEDKRGKSWVGPNAEFVKWCLKRMGVGLQHVFLDYILKCYPNQNLTKMKKEVRMEMVRACAPYRIESLMDLQHCKTLVGLGTLCGEVFTGYPKIGDTEGCEWVLMESRLREKYVNAWIGYNPGYALEKPAETVGIYRVIWKACVAAGLNPKFDATVKPFEGYAQ